MEILRDALLAALLVQVRLRGCDAREVVRWESAWRDYVEYPDCDTCQNAAVEIHYVDSAGALQVCVYPGDFGDLVESLVRGQVCW